MSRAVRSLLTLGVAALAAAGFLLHEKSEARSVVPRTTRPFVTDIVKKIVVAGALVPRREVTIKPHVSGVIEKLLIEPGQPVAAGALVAKIRIMPNMVLVDAAEARVSAARINLESAAREAERFSRLYQQGLSSQTEFNQYRLAHQLRKAELDAAESNRDLLMQGSSKKSLRVANVVTSTAGGTVLDVPIKVGSSVIEANPFNEGTTIASVADMNDMIFQGRIDESEVGQIREGMAVAIVAGALSAQHFAGKLEYIAPKGVEKDGTIEFQIKAALISKQGVEIRDNYSANADIVIERRDHVLAIQESLVSFDQGQPYVEVETEPRHFERRPVKLGLSDGLNVEILSGLAAETRIKQRESEP